MPFFISYKIMIATTAASISIYIDRYYPFQIHMHTQHIHIHIHMHTRVRSFGCDVLAYLYMCIHNKMCIDEFTADSFQYKIMCVCVCMCCDSSKFSCRISSSLARCLSSPASHSFLRLQTHDYTLLVRSFIRLICVCVCVFAFSIYKTRSRTKHSGKYTLHR